MEERSTITPEQAKRLEEKTGWTDEELDALIDFWEYQIEFASSFDFSLLLYVAHQQYRSYNRLKENRT